MSQAGEQKIDGSVESSVGHCEKHGPFEQKVISMFTGANPIRSRCPKCEAAAKAEREAQDRQQAEFERQRRCAEILAGSGIPKRFMGKTLDNYEATNEGQTAALQFARRFAKSDNPERSMILCGKPGTGKTHIACAIGQATAERLLSVRFATVLGAIRTVKDTYRRESPMSETEALRELQSPDLLILDEVGIQVGSEHEKMLVFEIINERYAQCRPTILISNLDESDLTQYLGERIIDRFREGGAVIPFDWASHRGARAA